MGLLLGLLLDGKLLARRSLRLAATADLMIVLDVVIWQLGFLWPLWSPSLCFRGCLL
jgi:hypothetical protein